MPVDKKPIVLLILDGWGYSEDPNSNAILNAKTPYWDQLHKQYPHTLVKGSGADVGLPSGQMGNSEVGHLNMGAGRVVYQEFTRVSRSVRTGSFFSNQTLTDAVDLAIETKKAVHILGLLSNGGVHSHEAHIQAMVKLAVERGAKDVYLHAFLDGRDTPPKSAIKFIQSMQRTFDELGSGRFASIIGRYYAMDRNHHWPRVKTAYDLITQGKSDFKASDALSGLAAAYERGETDEFIQATAVVPAGCKPAAMQDGDVLVFMNYRSDRARQITRPFIDPGFNEFDLDSRPRLARFASLTEYSADFDVPVAFPPERLKNVFGEHIAKLGLRQLRIAETEKYAHVTFFFNGGREQAYDGEDRILIQSPDVATYDLQPEMSAYELTDKLVAAINGGKYDVIICNYANPDMVGHTGNYQATVEAIESLDPCLEKVVNAAQLNGAEVLITADHGNAEKMLDFETEQPHTAHTANPVPFIYIGRPATLDSKGALSDVTPTILYLMGLEIPAEMGNHPLVKLLTDAAKPALHAVDNTNNDLKTG